MPNVNPATAQAFRDDPTDPRHGSLNGYASYRCRCRPCKDAARLYSAQRRANRKRGEGAHGTANTYRALGCRCEACRAAHLRAWQDHEGMSA